MSVPWHVLMIQVPRAQSDLTTSSVRRAMSTDTKNICMCVRSESLSGFPDFPDFPDIGYSGIYGYPEYPEYTDIEISGISGNPDFRISGFPDCRKARFPDIRISGKSI